jgi:hypothetical protein
VIWYLAFGKIWSSSQVFLCRFTIVCWHEQISPHHMLSNTFSNDNTQDK